MTWKTIFLLSILMVCSFNIMVSPSQEFRPHNEHGITTVTGHVNGTKSDVCSVDFLKKTADCSNRQLKDVPNNLINDLRSLDLSSNFIRSLRNTSFLMYSLLEKLDLSNNLIGFMDLATFFPVDQLISLSLDHNPIFTLPGSDIFQESKRLSSLSLQFCNLSYFPNDTLGFLPQLQSLDLMGNELTYINISKCPKRTLTMLDFSSNTFQEISADVLSLPCRTDTLCLGGNSFRKIDADVVADFPIRALVFEFLIPGPGQTFEVWKNLFTGIAHSEIDEIFLLMAFTDVPPDFFDPLRGKRLSNLKLQQNEFKCYPSIFANLTSVYKMELISFHIGVLESAFFDGMKELRSLTATNTKIEQVNPSGSSWKIDLWELDLSENNLGNLSPFAFKGLTNLTFLDLTNNAQLMETPTTSLAGLDNLRTFNVSRTRISAQMTLHAPLLEKFVFTFRPFDWWRSLSALIPGKTFQYTPHLDCIELDNSYVILRELWDSSENISLFQGLRNLRYLGLKQNKIGSLPFGVFDSLFKLQVLDLSDCEISTIESGAFASITSLTTLSLQNNNLQILPLHIFDNLIHLSTFFIGNNALFYIDKALFAKTQMITWIDLARNQLSVFNQTTFSQISTTLSSIDLSQNPIECSCKSQWLIMLLRGAINVQNGKETTCSFSSPKPFGGEALEFIQPNDLCTANVYVYFLTVFFVVIVVIVVVIVYHYRWQLSHKLFLLRLAILGYIEIMDENDREDYDSDVCIISARGNDENWIQDKLKPFLQRFLPHYKRIINVFEDNDLPLGMHRTDAIDHVLTRSYKILVLLSNAACVDYWFLKYFRMAIDQVDETQTENMVVVFLENIEEDKIPYDVRKYMGGQGPFVEWMEDDEEGQTYFWKRLEKYLSVNRKRNHLIPA
ncbi:toll-like receptor 4 [Strongylocentrotus purpuratus]|uniref:TIR domain-containing protein n=1 Tax=Strongylocentrotus purpuratus TaxID=7668 RepID=A0A7M7P4R2_STRPU|nr:toll-like receptor 4 [Strongylocentrotus purpuratus]